MSQVLRSAMAMLAAMVALAVCGQKPAEQASPDDSVKHLEHTVHFRSLDPSILASIPDDKHELAIVDYVHAKIGNRHEREAEMVAAMPAGIRALYVTWLVEAEVNNGGFNQFYWNSSGQFAQDAVAAFQFFSADKHAALMQEANRVRADEKAQIDRFKQQGTLQAFSESYKHSKLEPLDERFYKLDENLSALRIARIRAAPGLFSAE